MRNRNKGFSLIELLIVVAIILIIAAIAIPNLLRSKMTANEAAAVGALRALNSACITYATIYGQFPLALSNLAPAASGGASSTAADMIDAVLANGTKSGYKFTYKTPGTSGGAAGITYDITAVPLGIGTTGQRAFFSDQSALIRANPTGANPAQTDPPL
jgi:type IV pilus assembly protein PilA